METLEEQCNRICKNSSGDTLRYQTDPDLERIANELALLLIESDSVNKLWLVNQPDAAQEGIVNFLNYMDDNLIIRNFNEVLIKS
jgi:hypothetical protein